MGTAAPSHLGFAVAESTARWPRSCTTALARLARLPVDFLPGPSPEASSCPPKGSPTRQDCEGHHVSKRNIPDDQPPGSQKPSTQPLQQSQKMAVHRGIDYTSRVSGKLIFQWKSTGTRPGGQPGIQTIGELQRALGEVSWCRERHSSSTLRTPGPSQDRQGQTYMVSHTRKCDAEWRIHRQYLSTKKACSSTRQGTVTSGELMLAEGGKSGTAHRPKPPKSRRTGPGTRKPHCLDRQNCPCRASITTTSSASTQNPNQRQPRGGTTPT